MTADKDGTAIAYPDTVFGTDSHTTMINGIGVVGWGVGGIEAEAGMLGQPVYFLTPDVVGVELKGQLRGGVTATDLVLTITEMLRREKVVGKFVEFCGEGTASLTVAERATIGNMAPEYGATCGIFPIDAESLNYLRLSGRSEEQINLPACPVQHHAGTGHGHGEAVAGRPEAPAGPRAAGRRAEELPRSAGGHDRQPRQAQRGCVLVRQ
ncbi:hypothetical protein G6F57_018606 [Rhizopus arrhizus]|nr:hypothetical protein G6F57_018606 [Rhizopus arrhizus]